MWLEYPFMCRQVFGFRLAMIALATPTALVNANDGFPTRLVGAAGEHHDGDRRLVAQAPRVTLGRITIVIAAITDAPDDRKTPLFQAHRELGPPRGQ